jgi:hypothetical protein
MGTCTFIDYMIGRVSSSSWEWRFLYSYERYVFFCDFCTAVQCAPKLGVFYLSVGSLQICLRECILQALKPTHGTHWVQQQLEHWWTASRPVAEEDRDEERQMCVLIHQWRTRNDLCTSGFNKAAAKQCRVENVYGCICDDLHQGQVTQSCQRQPSSEISQGKHLYSWLQTLIFIN